MKINSTLTNRAGDILNVVYTDIEYTEELTGSEIKGVHAYCFYDGKIIIVYNAEKNSWSLPGGGAETGESFMEATVREIKEETNMRVVSMKLLGCQEIDEYGKTIRQTRSVCIVEPYGDFESDPDGDISEIKFIDPKDLKSYVDWGEVGNHLLARALEFQKLSY